MVHQHIYVSIKVDDYHKTIFSQKVLIDHGSIIDVRYFGKGIEVSIERWGMPVPKKSEIMMNVLRDIDIDL